MNNYNLDRRRFLQSAFYSSLLYGAGALPQLSSVANAAPAPLQNRILANLFLAGGPDLRHLVVPAFDATPGSFGDKYWIHRARSHELASTGVTAEDRWNNDYFPITVGSTEWNNTGLVDPGGLNSGVTFGIWREAGWLIDMFMQGNVALAFNTVGGTNRAHDLSTLMLDQGNVLSDLNDRDRSGWGGRLARSAGGRSLSLTSSPSPFNFGPLGAAPNYNPDGIDNIDLLSVSDSRNIGLFDFNIDSTQYNNRDDKMARAAKSYYAGLRQEQTQAVYQKFLDHEETIRVFGDLISGRLESVPIPDLIRALRDNGVNSINPDPNDLIGTPARRVLRRTSLGTYIRNMYDMIAANDLVSPTVMSMSYGSWDTHGSQRQVPGVLAGDPGNGVLPDPNNPFVNRGIENGLKDIFGGQFGPSPSDPSAWHGGFSALYASLPSQADRDKIVVTIAGEFGRQIRDNGGFGTDHGKGNLMFVISESCQGGVYGDMFPADELPKYDEAPNRTPDITPRTEIDSLFSKVSDWVSPGSSTAVFPRTDPAFSGDAPLIELAGMFDNLMI